MGALHSGIAIRDQGKRSDSPEPSHVSMKSDHSVGRNINFRGETRSTKFSTDRSRIAFIISRLTGKALDWATAVWASYENDTYDHFLSGFQSVFDHPHDGKSYGELLTRMRQGSRSVAEYSLEFRTIAAGTGWNEPALLTFYRLGLNQDVLTELAFRDDDDLSLDELITLAIRLDHLKSRSSFVSPRTPFVRTPRSAPHVSMPTPQPRAVPRVTSEPSPEEPMQCDSSRLSRAERLRRLHGGLCLYCGAGGHFLRDCQVRPQRFRTSYPEQRAEPTLHAKTVSHPTPGMISKSLLIPVTLHCRGSSHVFAALIDSGAEGNFIHARIATQLRVPIVSLDSPLRIAAVDGDPVGMGVVSLTTQLIKMDVSALHSEELSLSVNSTTIESPEVKNSVCIPPEYSDLAEVFKKVNATKLPPHREYDCAIELINDQIPPKSRVYPLTQAEEAAMEEYIQEALSQGYIRPSTSPAAAGFFFVKKKDGGLRPCIDYRGLNSITKPYPYPLPLVPVALEQLRGATIFTKLDLRSAYNLVRIRKGDEWKTAFHTTRGHYEYRVMSFGLRNAPSVFQAFINDVLRDMIGQFVIAYIDDILIYSPDYSSHVQHVRQVLTRLLKHQLYVKGEKCEFHLKSTSFLGYVISPEGVVMDDHKVDAVVNWPTPKSVRDLQRFLGFAHFYRRFIRSFSTIAAHFTSLLKGNAKRLAWNAQAESAFNELKARFTSAPLLKHPDPSEPFVVEVDASNLGVGAVLSQRHGSPKKLYPIAFFSHKLSPAERNYGIGDRELLAMKLALEEWRHWLEGAQHPFLVLTDHKNLEYLRSARRLNSRHARWSLFFSRFDFKITYRPGSRNTKADSLSRIYDSEDTALPDPEPILDPKVVLAPVRWELDNEIDQSNSESSPPDSCPSDKIYVPSHLRDKLITWAHSSLTSGHPGETRTLQLVSGKYWWESMSSDIHRFVASCSTCSQCKIPRTLPAGKLMPLPIPTRPWSHIAVDFVTDLPVSQGHTVILTVVDRFSRGVRFIPFPQLPTAFQTAETLFNHVFRFFGIPEDIVSDRGTQFTSQVWTAFMERLSITVSLTSGYHPQSNGQCERVNQELGKFLRLYCHNNQNDWATYLPWAEMAQNSLISSATSVTPFQCMLGYQPPLMPWSFQPSDVPSVEHWMRRSEEVWEETHQHIEMVLRRNKHHADKRRGDTPTYVPGDRVWLSTRDFRFSEGCRKLLPKYIGPFKIVSKVNDVTYKLELPPQYRVCSSFHVSLLKPVVPGPLDEVTPETTPPAPIDVGGTPVYAVRRLLDSRRRGGTLQYLVDWEGYGPEERSWVRAADVLDPALVEEFHRCHPSRPAPRPRGRPRRLSLSPSLHRRRGRPRRRVPIPCRDREQKETSDSTKRNMELLFKELEHKVISLVKNQLKRFKKLLSLDYPACSEGEVEDQSVREEVLRITLHVLRNMNQTDLANELQSKLAPSSHQKLKSTLKEKCQKINEGISNPGTSKLLNEIYTELYITEGGSGEVNNEHEVRQIETTSRRPVIQETPIKCSDIFKDKSIRTVLTKGVAGIGKTVSVQKFILDWAEGKANQDVLFIFPLPFRELNLMKEKFSLEALLHQFFKDTKKLKPRDYHHYKVMFIFDGLDEYRLPLDFQNNENVFDVRQSASVDVLLTNLIKGNLLPSALLWITTRPAAANQIPPDCIDQVTEVRGFSDPQKEEYFRKRISDQSLAERIITHVKSSRSLYIMCHIPVFCWIAATVLERMLGEAESGEIPKTLTQMFTHFLIFQIKHSSQKYQRRSDTDHKQTRKIILALGKLAFHQLDKGNLIFYEEDLRECGIDVREVSVYSGVCTQIFREEFGLHLGKVFSFVHLSVQEFLAALYVFLSFISNNRNVLLQQGTRVLGFIRKLSMSDFLRSAVDKALQSENGHLDLFLRFLLGLSLESNQTLLRGVLAQTGNRSFKKEEIVEHIKEKIRENPSPEKTINLFHCLNELNDHSLMQEVQTYLNRGGSSGLSGAKLSPAQWSAVAFVMLNSEEELEEFDLSKFERSEECLLRLLPVARVSRKLMLSECSVTEKGCAALISALKSNPSHLRELSLNYSRPGESGVKLLSDLLEDSHCKLEKLELSECSVTEKGCAALISALKENPSHLRELSLSYSRPGESGVKLLSDLLEDSHCKLEKL
ncbi:hypothetical protein NFI96_000695, partial [Prochilodus magdalenae]